MKAILKTIKKTDLGETLYESSEELTPVEEGLVNTVKQVKAFQCPMCRALYEENHIRMTCPVCQTPCCPFCHEERKQAEKRKLEQHIIVEKERLRWIIESPRLFGHSWFMKLVRKIRWLNTMSKLDELQYRMERTNAKKLPWKNSQR